MIVVNRKYQRKLVWTLDEKRQFIDTIIRNYPVPLFLVVNNSNVKGENGLVQKEVIDGLQRLEAIISFINNEYSIIYKNKKSYFNLDVLPGKGQLIREGKLVQKKPVLDFDICKKIVGYQLPISTIETDDAEVENIFKRINSNGRKLSSQNLRQAGVTGLFNDLVYKTSAKLRGDYTDENIIELNEMPKYSLNSSGLNYGINIQNVFWIKQGIITEDGIRRSKDEEILANLYNCVLNNYDAPISRKTLNLIYDETTIIFKNNENKLKNGRDKELMDLFLSIFDDFNQIFLDNQDSFSNHLFKELKNYNKDLVFIILFVAMVQLRNEYYIIDDYSRMYKDLKDLASNELGEIISPNCNWNIKIRNRLIERVKNILKKSMAFKEVKTEWSQEIIELLKCAEVEEQMYDFKIGMTNLQNGDFNENVIPKCIKSLTAMANTNIGKEGIIVIGISDKESDSQDFKKYYGVEPPKYNNYYVTGVKDEAIKHYGSVEKYLDKIKSEIQKENNNIDSVALNYLLSKIRVIKYNEQVLVVLALKSDKPLFYKKELFVRYQSSNKKIETGSPEFYDIFKI